jgi:hypothetical protein
MDKEPGLGVVWLLFVVLGSLGYIAARARRWMLPPVLVLILATAGAVFQDLLDRSVGPAIIQESGWGYIIACALAVLVSLCMAIAGYRSRERAA